MGNQYSMRNRDEGLSEIENKDPVVERVINLVETIALSRDENECQTAVENFKEDTVIKSLLSQHNTHKFTPLHAIVTLLTFTQESELELLEWLVTEAPWMALEPRKGSFEGQTPLHMAICKNIFNVVQILLEKVQPEMKEQLLHMPASGSSFQQTVMRAELPLSIAGTDEPGYCYFDCKEGTFDIKMYDVTDIAHSPTLLDDTSGHGASQNQEGIGEAGPSRFFRSVNQQIVLRDKKPTPLDYLFTMKQDCAFEFVRLEPVSRLILQKWRFYRCLFYPTMAFHALFMCFLTWYAVKRSDIMRSTINDTGANITTQLNGMDDNYTASSNLFLTTCSFINLVAGVAYFTQELIRYYRQCLPFIWKRFFNPYANNGFRLGFVLFSIPLTVDVLARYVEHIQHYLLVASVLIGWSLGLFFLRALPQFCQFASLIQTVLTGEILRFFGILVLELIAFSTAMFMLLQGPDGDANFVKSWWTAFFISFQVMFGFSSISLRQSENVIILAILYILFVGLTTVLMVNSLIATLSTMCSKLFEADDEMIHLRLHQYAVIRFLESVLPDSLVQKVARETLHVEDRYIFDVNSDQFKKTTRYFVKMESLRNISGSGLVQDTFESLSSIDPDCDYQIDEDGDFSTGITGNMADAFSPKETNEEKSNTEEQEVSESPPMIKEIHAFGIGVCDVCHKTFEISSSLLDEINMRQNTRKMETMTENSI
ncbi:hypothetical protein ACJMK2_038575 [Sinanodonta woodiana]|uniref:Ion transport domain-containing protein n=1 Tax=Sinanodonta woodiana TaxID=1069815 RepID=A0ABD3WD72_SINWO